MWPTVPKQDTYYDTVVRWQNPKIMEKLAMSAKKNFFLLYFEGKLDGHLLSA